MIFVAAITTPKNTPSNAQLVTTIPIVAGKIQQVIVWFPPGLNGLAHIALRYGLYQIFPSNQEADLAGGDTLLQWPEDIDIQFAPFEVTAYTYNDDDTYDHTVTVHIVMQPASITPNPSQTIAQLIGG